MFPKVELEADNELWFLSLPNGFVYVGRVVEQCGQYRFRVTEAVMICRTNGVSWNELIAGKRRTEPTYQKCGEIFVGPQFVRVKRWVDDLPEVK